MVAEALAGEDLVQLEFGTLIALELSRESTSAVSLTRWESILVMRA
jgi:hypothetical protein